MPDPIPLCLVANCPKPMMTLLVQIGHDEDSDQEEQVHGKIEHRVFAAILVHPFTVPFPGISNPAGIGRSFTPFQWV